MKGLNKLIDPKWSFVDMVNESHKQYTGGGQMSTGYRTSLWKTWGNMVGKDEALEQLGQFIVDCGSKKKAAETLGISCSTLRKVELYYQALPKQPSVYVVPDYDVALSFAGEDRPYVKEVAECLTKLGVKVFYDTYAEADLWGRNLYTHLDDVYQKKAKYVVIFISQYYKDKLWTNHERESAQARAFQERGEYILPARFDKTVIPGIRITTGYIDLKDKSPNEFALLLARKIGLNHEIDQMIEKLKEYLPDHNIKEEENTVVIERRKEKKAYPIDVLLSLYRADLLPEFIRGLL